MTMIRPTVFFRGYLALRVPIHLAKLWPPNFILRQTFETLSAEQQIALFDCKCRIDSFHDGLGAQSEAARKILRKFAWFDRMAFDWHPWHALKQAGLTTPQVFEAVADSAPFGLGALNHKADVNLRAEFAKLALEAREDGRESMYFDYFNGVGMKMTIPRDFESVSENTMNGHMDVRRYNDRNSPGLAKRIGELLRYALPLDIDAKCSKAS
jgi:hypothetical protein